MAKMKKGIFGPVSGKIGPVVVARWKGINYVREAAQKPSEPLPRSAAQIANEQKMKFTNELLQPFHPYVNIGFENMAIDKTALSVAYSFNFHKAVMGEYPNLSVDYSKMVISSGLLPQLNQPVLKLIATDVLELTWQQNTNSKASFDDQVMLVLYSPELKITDGFTGGAKRTAKQCLFKFDPALVGTPLEVYLSVTSMNRKKVADSLYMGRVEPL